MFLDLRPACHLARITAKPWAPIDTYKARGVTVVSMTTRWTLDTPVMRLKRDALTEGTTIGPEPSGRSNGKTHAPLDHSTTLAPVIFPNSPSFVPRARGLTLWFVGA